MLKRIAALVAAFLLSLGFGLAIANPANAATIHGCPDNTTCLYQSTQYSYGVVRLSFQGIYQSANNCYNLGSVHFNSGTPDAQANNNTASLVVNTTGAAGGWNNWIVGFYDLANCADGAAGFFTEGAGASDDTSIPDLHSITMLAGTNAYHRISSVQMIWNPPPA